MKRNLMLFATALALLVTTAASAQTIKVKATVPFNFIVNRATMPAGEYMVESVDDQGKVLLIGDLNSKAKRLVVANSCDNVASATDTKLIFHRYGNRYFLSQVWVRETISVTNFRLALGRRKWPRIFPCKRWC